MATLKTKSLIPTERIPSRIYLIGGRKVMFDFDLAELYGVPTKALNQAVTRNAARFPDDFMLRLSEEETEALNRSQTVTGSGETSNRLMVLHGKGDGSFSVVKQVIGRLLVPTQTYGCSVMLSDFNLDGQLDVAIGVGSVGFVLLNDRTSAMTLGTWAAIDPMRTSRTAFGTARTPNGIIYAMGGVRVGDSSRLPSGGVEAYFPASNTWTIAASMPTPRYGSP